MHRPDADGDALIEPIRFASCRLTLCWDAVDLDGLVSREIEPGRVLTLAHLDAVHVRWARGTAQRDEAEADDDRVLLRCPVQRRRRPPRSQQA